MYSDYKSQQNTIERKLIADKDYIDRKFSGVHNHIGVVQGELHGVGKLVYSLKPGIGWILATIISISLNVGVNFIPQDHILEKPKDFVIALEDDFYEYVFVESNFIEDYLNPSLTYGVTGDFSKSIIFDYLTPAELGALNHTIMGKESANSGGYKAYSPYCYAGGHQFGAAMLSELGYVKIDNFEKQSKATKRGLGSHCKFMGNDNNWNIKGGLQTFLNSPNIQDAAFMKMLEGHIRTAKRNGVINDSTPAKRVGGLLMSAQFGIDRAIRWYKLGIDSKDGNKTRTSYYANVGEQAVKNANSGDLVYLPSVLLNKDSTIVNSDTLNNNEPVKDTRKNAIIEKLIGQLSGK
jgi:hypothetical protein